MRSLILTASSMWVTMIFEGNHEVDDGQEKLTLRRRNEMITEIFIFSFSANTYFSTLNTDRSGGLMIVIRTLTVQIDSSVFFSSFSNLHCILEYSESRKSSKSVSDVSEVKKNWFYCITKTVSSRTRKRYRRHRENRDVRTQVASVLKWADFHRDETSTSETSLFKEQYSKRCCRIENSYVDQDQYDKIHNTSRPDQYDRWSRRGQQNRYAYQRDSQSTTTTC